MKIKTWMALAVLIPLLHACGGGGSGGGSGALRLVNVSDDQPSLDLYASDGSTETLLSSAVATDAAGSYVSLGATTLTLNLKRTGTATTSGTSTRTVLKDTSHTLLAYSTSSSLRSVFLTDAEVAPAAGIAKLRVFNASNEAGTLDVYVTDPAAALADSSPTVSALAGERIGSYTEIGAGSYRIRVTGTGVSTDLRLDLPAVSFASQQIVTLVLTSGSGGVLVHGHLINQKDTVAAQRNPAARVRLVTGTVGGTVAAAVNGTTLSAGQGSPIIGAYQLVPAGTLALSASLNGTAATPNGTTTPLPATLAAGSDNTLLVTSNAGAATATLLADDNRPPLNTANTKLRLVHGVGNLASPITLTADSGLVATDVAVNSASVPVAVTGNVSTGTTLLEATSPGFAGTLYSDSKPLLPAHTYTVFMLGDVAAVAPRLSRDR